MQNPRGELFDSINSFLHGKKKLNPNAAQFLMLADAANTEVSSGKLTIMNRHAMFDAMVYGSNELQPTVLSTHPLFNVITHTIIVDRLPTVALESVKKRGTEQRIFEKRLDQMFDLHMKYASLTYLPGVRWLNTDFDAKTIKEQINSSVNRLFYYVKSFGILQRTMVKLGLAENYVHASIDLEDKFGAYKTQNHLWLDS